MDIMMSIEFVLIGLLLILIAVEYVLKCKKHSRSKQNAKRRNKTSSRSNNE